MQTKQLERFVEAAAWVEENGMTLPPDTPQYRSLRNWFCFKLNQFKKGTLGKDNEALLAMHGLDFSEYQALRSARGVREPDQQYITEMSDWFAANGTYDLDQRAPPELLRWQRLMLDNYSSRGDTGRIAEIRRQLPGLVPGLWRTPTQPPFTEADRQWWDTANEFWLASQEHPSYLGQVNPKLPMHLIQWAATMIARSDLEKSRHDGRQRGFLIGVGLVIDRAEREKRHRKERERAAVRTASLARPEYGQKDKRLTSWLGMAMFSRMVCTGAPDKELMSAFGIGPIDLIGLRERTMPYLGSVVLTTQYITYARMLFLNGGVQLIDEYTSYPYPDKRIDWPATMNKSKWAVMNAIHQAYIAALDLNIEQEICVY